MHLVSTGKPPQLTLPESKQWHIFLSHTWKTGQDQVLLNILIPTLTDPTLTSTSL